VSSEFNRNKALGNMAVDLGLTGWFVCTAPVTLTMLESLVGLLDDFLQQILSVDRSNSHPKEDYRDNGHYQHHKESDCYSNKCCGV